MMAPGSYTELFFLDEVTALAAGHRPCFECRHHDAVQFSSLWSLARRRSTRARAADIDRALHAERLDPSGEKQLHDIEITDLPDGAMFLEPTTKLTYLVHADRLLPWSFEGYGRPVPRPSQGVVAALTPPSIIGILKLGYAPKLHETGRVSG